MKRGRLSHRRRQPGNHGTATGPQSHAGNIARARFAAIRPVLAGRLQLLVLTLRIAW